MTELREIRAFVHEVRIADILHALAAAGLPGPHGHLVVSRVQGTLSAVDPKERDYSLALGEQVTDELRLELYLPAERLDEAITLIERQARTQRPRSAWLFIYRPEQARVVSGGS